MLTECMLIDVIKNASKNKALKKKPILNVSYDRVLYDKRVITLCVQIVLT